MHRFRTTLPLALLATTALCATVATLVGCASGVQLGRPSATQPATRPTPETITVELDVDRGPFAPRAHGYLRPSPAAQPTRELLAPLGPLAQGTEGAEPAVLVTLGESVKFDGKFPGENGNWTKWDRGLADLLKQHQADPRPRVYELWKEPDKGALAKDRTNFFGAWVHTARTIRRLAPKAILMGPSISKHDGGYTGEFLKVAKEYDVLPDVVSWHEENLKQDVSGHVNQAGEAFWQDGTGRNQVVISAAVNVDDKHAAGDVPIYLAQVEKALRDNAWRPLTFHWGFKLTHLFTNDAQPRSAYHAWREYADLANAGRNARVTAAPTVEGLALFAEPTRTARLLLGRNRSRVDAKQVPGDVTLEVKGADAATAHVRARRIENTGAKPSTGPVPAFERDVPVDHGAFRIPLPDFASGDAYAIEITLRGGPATRRTNPTADRVNNTDRPQ
jgi:hypothetical protein